MPYNRIRTCMSHSSRKFSFFRKKLNFRKKALVLIALAAATSFSIDAPATADPLFRPYKNPWDATQPYNWRGNLTLNRNGIRNGLPPTSMDSFVYEAGSAADQIYGDEGDTGLPPIDQFRYENRINSGIFDQRNAGLTTGHGSYLPSAWGNDEFQTPGGEWSQSGATVTFGDQSVGFGTTPIAALEEFGLTPRGVTPASPPPLGTTGF